MLKRLQLLALGLVLAASSAFGQAVSTWGQLGVNGTNLVDKNGNPVQLQGMSLFWSNWKEGYNYWNSGTIQTLRDDWCINVIRAPMGVDEENGYISQPTTNMNRVKAVIDAAIALDIYVIVDYHSHYAHNYKSQAKTFFAEIAQTYGSYDNIIYEVYNEPLNVSWNNTIKPYCEDVIDEIRKYDTDNVIICGTRQWSQRVDEAAANPITGRSNIAYALHYYAGTHFNQERAWAQTAIDNGLCLFVTEYGTVNADGDGGVNTSNSNTWWSFIEDNNLSHCNWSVSNKNEGASILNSSVTNTTGSWTNSDYTTSGTLVKNYLNSKCPNYGTSAPTITKDIEDVEVYDGYDASFKVFASGGDLSYQWYNDNGIINGATTNTYEVTSASSADAMQYWVVVTNSQGSVTSNKANLTISATSPFNGDPILIKKTGTTRIDISEFDIGTNFSTTPSGASYNDDTPGNIIPANEGNGPSNVRSGTDADITTTWDDNGNRYSLSRNAIGEWWNYSVEVEQAGYYDVEIRCIAGVSGNKINLEFDGVNVTGDLNVPVDAGYYPLQGATKINVQLDAGVQIMRLNVAAGYESNISDIKISPSADADCYGELFGSASIDNCGVCSGGNTGITANSLCEQDCNGDWGGDAYLDNCNICVGGATNKTACVEDCNGDWGGTAYLDNCSICVAGNTGKTDCVNTSIESENSKAVTIAPNPFENTFSILSEVEVEWTVSSILGKTIATGTGNKVDLSEVGSGTYILQLSSGETIKIIKK